MHFLYFAVLLFVHIVNAANLPSEVCDIYNSSGDVYIGGIFTLHGDGPGDGECGGRLSIAALQLTEAMVFAVNTINQDNTVLPNITLGFFIHDDCSRAEYAMWGSLSLVMGANPTLEGNRCIIPGGNVRSKNRRAIGIIGTETTSSSEVVISTAGLFKTPQISYGATGEELYEEHWNPYFFGTISSDVLKAQAIIDILAHFQWEYVAVVYSSDQDTLDLEHEVAVEAPKQDICMYINTMVSEVPTQAELQELVTKLQENPSAQAVVLLTLSSATANAVMSAVRVADPPLNPTWVAGDSWGNELIQNGNAQGAIFIEYLKPKLVAYEDYFRSLAISNDNPWYGEFCGDSDNCLSSSEEGFSTLSSFLAPTIDAVFALAHALDKTFRDRCSGSLLDCLAGDAIDDDSFVENLRHVSFPGTRGNFSFEHSSVPGQFTIRNMQYIDGRLKLGDIGSWSSALHEAQRLNINETLIQWYNGEIPRSVCREECRPGYVVETDPVKKCCWGCRACRLDDIVNGTKCVTCENKEWPNHDFTVCARLVANTVTLDEPLVVTLVIMASLGLLLCGLTSFGMIRHRQQPLIKASSRELSCVNIIGIIVSLVAVFPFLHPPSPGSCGAAQSLYVLSFTLMYAPMLLKVNRIYRIFESSTKTVKRPRFTGSTAQLLIVAVLVIIQPVVMLITAIAVPGTWISTVDLFPTPSVEDHRRTLEIFCSLDVGFLTAMCYNFLLLLACCLYAYKARNVPGNFNEARFYVASVYTTLVPIVAALPLYITADRAVVLAFSVGLVPIITGYVTLACVYLSKLYAVTFGYEEQNAEEASRAGNSTMQTRMLSGAGGSKVHPAMSTIQNKGASSSQMDVVT